MNKLLTTIILLCFSVAANAETYVCSSSTDDDLYTFKREGVQFFREGGVGTLQFFINSENDRWLLLSNAQIGDWARVGDNAYFQFIVVSINKETLDYYIGTHSNIFEEGLLGYVEGAGKQLIGGKCTRL